MMLADARYVRQWPVDNSWGLSPLAVKLARQEVPMRRPIDIRCTCCELPRSAFEYDGEPRPTICALCSEHRAVNLTERRAIEHEALLRDALEVASSWADEAYRERTEYKDRMHAAYGSREISLRYLRDILNLHRMRPDGSCSCGRKRGCPSAELLQKPWVHQQVTKLEKIEAQHLRELAMEHDDDSWINAWDEGEGLPSLRREA
jgi:hypothetical protein